MQRRSVRGLLYSAVVLLAGCGSSGTWEDDAENWDRAFRSTKPADVVVVHSKYWRSPHFATEFQYFFHVQANEPLHQQLMTENKLVKLDGDAVSLAAKEFFGEKPAWFLPKDASAYETWVFVENPQHFRVFVDKETGDLFLTDYVV